MPYRYPMRQLSLALLVSLMPAAATTIQHIACPAEIRRDTIEISHPPAGWTPVYLSAFQPGLPLNSAGLAWGAPSSMTMSRPDWSGRIAGRDVIKWRDLVRKGPLVAWISCYYGERGQNDAILSRRVDADATECSVIYPQRSGGIIDVVCK